MSFSSWLSIAVPVLVTVVIGGITILSIFKYRSRIDRALDTLEARGKRVKQLKDEKIMPWICFIPIPADALTYSRPLLILSSVIVFADGRLRLAVALYVIGWLTDLLDGPRARYEAILRAIKAKLSEPQPTRHGPFLDPGADIICDALTIGWLGGFFSGWLVWVFSVLVAIRAVYGILAIIKEWRPQRLPENIQLLPESILGKYKRVVLFLAFGLVITLPASRLAQGWAALTLALAVIMEIGSLVQQVFRWSRQRRRPPLFAVRRASNE